MDATTMPLNSPLITSLIADFPDFHFEESDEFHWSPDSKTIHFDSTDPLLAPRLLHEVSHAALGHATYSRDIELIAMERDAWQHARVELGPRYSVEVDADTIHYDMDSYRDWMHQRSTCPHCGSSGIQTKKHAYRCVSCRGDWRVNDARTCALRRYTAQQQQNK